MITKLSNVFVTLNILFYADDTKIFKEITLINDCEDIKSNLARVENYCATNNLYLTLGKCQKYLL